jgi:hypothetical protein
LASKNPRLVAATVSLLVCKIVGEKLVLPVEGAVGKEIEIASSAVVARVSWWSKFWDIPASILSTPKTTLPDQNSSLLSVPAAGPETIIGYMSNTAIRIESSFLKYP